MNSGIHISHTHNPSSHHIIFITLKLEYDQNVWMDTMNKIRLLLLSQLLSASFGWRYGSLTSAAFAGTHVRDRQELVSTSFAGTTTRRRPKASSSSWFSTHTPALFLDQRRFNSTGSLGRGNGKPKSSTELSVSMADFAYYQDVGYKIYCDLDGVLVDFEKGVQNLLKRPSSQLVKGTMWKTIAKANAFYENLDWTQDGKRLWEEIRHLRPDILTGVPYPKSSRIEKYNWCKRELGLDHVNHVDMAAGCRDHQIVNGNLPKEDTTNVITCWSNNKHLESNHRS